MAAAAALYTPEILTLATGLAAWPFDPALGLTGEARSRSCGSTITVSLSRDNEGRIERLGLRPHACAIGQAAAAIFARAALGRGPDELAEAERQIMAWLAGEGALPAWPGFAVLAPARSYPGRHEAVPLAWRAALSALSSAADPR